LLARGFQGGGAGAPRMIRFANFGKYDEGNDGYYIAVTNELGCKVLKRGSLLNAQSEFLFNLYVQEHEATAGLTSEAIACGTAMVQHKGIWKMKPVIWMTHIDGVNCYQHALNLGWASDPSLKEEDALIQGYQSETYSSILAQMTRIHRALKMTGYSGWDHEHAHNYFLADDGKVRAIDFRPQKNSIGKIVENPVLLKTIYERYGHALVKTLPEDYLFELVSLGLMD